MRHKINCINNKTVLNTTYHTVQKKKKIDFLRSRRVLKPNSKHLYKSIENNSP